MEVNVKCVHCKAQDYAKAGFRKTEHRGNIQKYFCNSCKKYFTNDEGFYRMRNSESVITKALDLYFSNLSSRKLRDYYKRHSEALISHVSVLDWCRRFTMKVQKYVDTLQPQLSGEFYADETFIDCQRRKDRFWVAVDWQTRFIPSIHYSIQGNVAEAQSFFSKLKEKSKPKFVQTDSAQFYRRAFRRTFYSNEGDRSEQPKHIVNNVSKTKVHNVRIETVFMKIKDRVQDCRGFKALWSAPILLAGIVLQHNFIQEHTTTRKHPSELAGIKFDGLNRWLAIIKCSTYA